jgi:hypothetical protein
MKLNINNTCIGKSVSVFVSMCYLSKSKKE